MSIEKRLDEYLSQFNDDEQERILRYALDHIVPRMKSRAALSQQPATTEPVAWPLKARVWKRESTQEWVLEISGTLGDTDMNIRHTQPLSVAYENVPGLPTIYTHPAPSVFLVRDIASLLNASVPDVCNALAELGYEPRRSTNATISPDEALAVASRISPAPSVPDDVALTIHELRHLADKFSEGWHEGIKIDAMDVMLLSDAARKLEIMQAAMLAAKEAK